MLIEAEKLEKTYVSDGTPVPALRVVDLRVAEGEVTAIMGRSGSGKTTLISLIGGLDYPSGGKLTIDGISLGDLDHNRLSAFRKEDVGFIFQQFHLVPYLSAHENVMLPLVVQDMPHAEKKKRAEEALRQVGLENVGCKLPAHLSGGEQQRVAIARAIVNKPLIIIADEPTGNLDSETGASIMGILKQLNENGSTVLLVTHDANVAGMARRIVHIKDGRIDREVTKKQVKKCKL